MNPSNCECDKSCDVGEYLDYKNCKCRNKLVEECENVNGNEMVENVNDHGNICNSCTIYIVLFVIALLIIIDIMSAFLYFHW